MLATLIFQLPRLDFSRDDIAVFCTKFHSKRTRETPFQEMNGSHSFSFKRVGFTEGVANV